MNETVKTLEMEQEELRRRYDKEEQILRELIKDIERTIRLSKRDRIGSSEFLYGIEQAVRTYGQELKQAESESIAQFKIVNALSVERYLEEHAKT